MPVQSIWAYQLRILDSVRGVEIVFELLLISQLEGPKFAFGVLLSDTCVVIAES